jgi:hypothetical protein
MIKVMGQLIDQQREKVPLRFSEPSFEKNFITFCFMVSWFPVHDVPRVGG